jgi:hypothetical protein
MKFRFEAMPMNSLRALLSEIVRNPLVDNRTKFRATFLLHRLWPAAGRDPLADLMEWL